MSSDSDTVTKELRSSEYECINQEEIKEQAKPAIQTKIEKVQMNIEQIQLKIRYKNNDF